MSTKKTLLVLSATVLLTGCSLFKRVAVNVSPTNSPSSPTTVQGNTQDDASPSPETTEKMGSKSYSLDGKSTGTSNTSGSTNSTSADTSDAALEKELNNIQIESDFDTLVQ